MKFNISYPRTGGQKSQVIDEEKFWGRVVDKKIGQEFEGELLGDKFKGYIFRITGGYDKTGLPMVQGINLKGRIKLLLGPNSQNYRPKRTGERRRRSVRGSIVGSDIGTLHLKVIKKGELEIEGVTNKKVPKRLGPKRANKIRKLLKLPRHSQNIKVKKGEKAKKITQSWIDVKRNVVRRTYETKKGKKKITKAPKIQRLVTVRRLVRKRRNEKARLESVQRSDKLYTEYKKKLHDYVEKNKKAKEDEKKAAEERKKQAAKPVTKDAKKDVKKDAPKAQGKTTGANTAGKNTTTTANQARPQTAVAGKNTTAAPSKPQTTTTAKTTTTTQAKPQTTTAKTTTTTTTKTTTTTTSKAPAPAQGGAPKKAGK